MNDGIEKCKDFSIYFYLKIGPFPPIVFIKEGDDSLDLHDDGKLGGLLILNSYEIICEYTRRIHSFELVDLTGEWLFAVFLLSDQRGILEAILKLL